MNTPLPLKLIGFLVNIKNMKGFLKTTFTLILLAVIALGVNELILAQEDPGSLVSEREAGVTSSTEREILSLLLELRSISLSSDIFQSAVFRSLRDFGVTLAPQPVGRDNPFAPIDENTNAGDNDADSIDNIEDPDSFEDFGDLDDFDLDDFDL